MLTTSTNTRFEDFFLNCLSLADTLKSREDELLQLLSKYETYDAAKDEITRSIETLEGMRKEIAHIKHSLQDLNIATFFPLNLPLYSLVLFGLAPSVFAKNVFIRPPKVMHEMLLNLWEFLDIGSHFPAVSLKVTPRHIFVELYASESDVIIFTGKHGNALDVHKHCPDALLLYNGSGINPFLIFENADIDLAAEKALEMRCFNSGQDCAGPDAFFVPASKADEFTQKLKAALKDIKVGDTADPKTRVGPTIKESYITELEDWLQKEQPHVVFGGKIDTENHLVYPTIIRKKVEQHDGDDFHEFFAPFFYVLEYSNHTDLEKVLLSDHFKEKGMYVSVFGDEPKIEQKLNFVKILKNKIVNDVERGNQEYGGYGSHANFLLLNNQKVVKPVLISRDIHLMLSH